jgi:hypothetical protein
MILFLLSVVAISGRDVDGIIDVNRVFDVRMFGISGPFNEDSLVTVFLSSHVYFCIK